MNQRLNAQNRLEHNQHQMKPLPFLVRAFCMRGVILSIPIACRGQGLSAFYTSIGRPSYHLEMRVKVILCAYICFFRALFARFQGGGRQKTVNTKKVSSKALPACFVYHWKKSAHACFMILDVRNVTKFPIKVDRIFCIIGCISLGGALK
ncbi:hypothetical protein C6I21_11250 [Alkalicoccus urumqiensis]|uniref:Uncharacterized protein n=1 Tax=Alkalicoccus urumqiensis TaxID=1548213 RepID=A0A2P6MFD8_ALKUR|nr:hypothetical protein C6I21_11250 [Alkalicoccus urumqiensis]